LFSLSFFSFLFFYIHSTKYNFKTNKQKNYNNSPKTIRNLQGTPSASRNSVQQDFWARDQCWNNGGAWVHAPPLELQNNRGSVAASPLLPLTGSENHCHLQKEKNNTRQ